MADSVQTQVATVPQPIAATGSAGGREVHEFLAFRLGEEEYGMDILRVQEIRSFSPPTQLASTPGFILGVINLRGVIVPIVDMRLKLGLAQPRYDASTVVIVLNFADRVAGMVVDSVSDVLTLEPGQLHAVPELDASVLTDHLMAIGSLNGRTLLLLDIDGLMRSPEMGLNGSAPPAAPAAVH